MRRLGDLWRSSNPAEKAFVEQFLKNTARRGRVTEDTWRAAQNEWEKAVKLQNDLGKPFPEVAAQVFLTIVISAESKTDAIRRLYGGP